MARPSPRSRPLRRPSSPIDRSRFISAPGEEYGSPCRSSSWKIANGRRRRSRSPSLCCRPAAPRGQSTSPMKTPPAVTRRRSRRHRPRSRCSPGRRRRPQAIRSVIRIIATALLTLDACSLVFLLQVQTKFFLAETSRNRSVRSEKCQKRA
jgi:hypothetical protein